MVFCQLTTFDFDEYLEHQLSQFFYAFHFCGMFLFNIGARGKSVHTVQKTTLLKLVEFGLSVFFCSIVCFSLNVRYKLCDDNPLTPERSGNVNELGIFGKEFTKWLTTRCRRMWNMNSCVEFAGALLLLLYLFCAPCCWSCVRVCVYALFWVGCMD